MRRARAVARTATVAVAAERRLGGRKQRRASRRGERGRNPVDDWCLWEVAGVGARRKRVDAINDSVVRLSNNAKPVDRFGFSVCIIKRKYAD